MRRRHLLVATGSAFVGAGCLGRPDPLNDASPTKSKEPSTADGETSLDTDATSSPDCTFEELVMFNDMSTQATVSVRLVEGWGRYRGGSPTATKADSPTESPTVTFADEVSITPDGEKEYLDLPEASGRHRFEIAVENGPSGTDYIQAHKWGEENIMMASITSGGIAFTYGVAGRTTECA